MFIEALFTIAKIIKTTQKSLTQKERIEKVVERD
jgi:hypothetical protein